MRLRQVGTHVRRYPRWYAIAAAWLVAMLVLPVVEIDPLSALPGRSNGPAATTVTAPVAPGALGGGGGLAPLPDGSTADVGDGSAVAGDATTTTTTGPPELALVPEELLDVIFDFLPVPVIPPLPPELATLAAAIAPIATTGCSGLGLASIIVAVVAQSAEGVPIGRLIPYLAPVSSACASFPIPEVHTVCTFDKPFVVDVGGLTNTPPILGLGIDQIAAMEDVLAATFGMDIPRLAPVLREQLDCEVVGRTSD